MSQDPVNLWSRRAWLAHQSLGVSALIPSIVMRQSSWVSRRATAYNEATRSARVAAQAERIDEQSWLALAQRAVDAARAAGARYADARLTRIVKHTYSVAGANLNHDEEYNGVGVRVLVDGAWGFSASAVITPDEVVRLAHDAVSQASENGQSGEGVVDLGTYPIATGSWSTPVRIDPFTMSIEEKSDSIASWKMCAAKAGVDPVWSWLPSWLAFTRQERVVATSEGAAFTQTVYESGGFIDLQYGNSAGNLFGSGNTTQTVHGIDVTGAGWELFVDANIPDQFLSGQIHDELVRNHAIARKPGILGRYTLVCDGATMAELVDVTLGVATQLDRALGYEADARGTSWIDDPLAMVGSAQVAASPVTLTANRSVPRALGTSKWDDEGVIPDDFTLIRHGMLMDFQTTREQAAWLAPYYHRHGLPGRSHGCAGAESAHVISMQHMPNLSLEPVTAPVRLEEMVADVKEGILIENGSTGLVDHQASTGRLTGDMREIVNGRLGKRITAGSIAFNSRELWKNVTAVGGPATRGTLNFSPYTHAANDFQFWGGIAPSHSKGQPSQMTSHTVHAAAATIANQALIDPSRKV